MARSLARNTKVFVTTLGTGTAGRAEITTANMTTSNTWEIKVLDGYSYTQDAASQDVGVNEAASEAECSSTGIARGTQTFNTALNPVDVSFSTYVRPYENGSGNGDCVEKILWASAMGTQAGLTASPDTPAAGATYNQDGTSITFGLATSNASELLPLTLCFVLENATYVVEQFNVGSAEVDFSIDGIATINWTGNGSRVNEDPRIHSILKTNGTAVKDTDYVGVPVTTTTTFLRNKLSTLEISNNEIYGFDKTAAGVADGVTSVAGGVVTLDTGGLTPGDYIGGIIYNTTKDEWAFIFDNAAGTVSVSGVYAAMANTWESTDAVKLFLPAQDDLDTVGSISGPVITLGTGGLTVNAYSNGRILNLNDGEWATILSNAAGTVTVISSDQTLVNTWGAGAQLALYTEDQHAGVVYCIPITGATLTLENNITYLTPEELAIVNLPLAGFAGSRITSGSFTAYLNTGAQGSAGLLADLLAKIEASVSTNYHLTFHMGGASTTYPRVDFDIPHANVSIPTTNVEDIISTEISFTAKPWDTSNNVASFEDTNEITITYVASAT